MKNNNKPKDTQGKPSTGQQANKPGNVTEPSKGKEHKDTDHPHQEQTPTAKPGGGQ